MQLESFLEESAGRFPDKTALIFDRQRITYCEIETRCNRLAHAMVERGLRPGDRVGFLGIGSGLNCLMLGVDW